MSTKVQYTMYGLNLGNIIAVTLSYSINKSILWAMLHGTLGWFYVIYFAIFHHGGI